MLTIPQEYIGLANVVGDCYCFGLAVHLKLPVYKYIPVFLNVTGASSSVDALWAKLAQGKPSSIVRDTEPSIPLEPDDKGLYVRYQKKVEGLGIDHLLLVHRDLAEPQYPTGIEPTTVYLLWTGDAQGQAKLGEHVRHSVKVAVFDEWYAYLASEGRQHGLVKSLTCYGGVNALSVTLDTARWTTLIIDGLQAGRIRLPA
jgi:hypothetical protein